MTNASAIKFLIEEFSVDDTNRRSMPHLRRQLWDALSVRRVGERLFVDGRVRTAVRKLTARQAATLRRDIAPFVSALFDRWDVARRLPTLVVSRVRVRALLLRGTVVFQIGGPLRSVFLFHAVRLFTASGDMLPRFGRCEAPRAGSWERSGSQLYRRCGQRFYRSRLTRRFCSARCRARLWAREHGA